MKDISDLIDQLYSELLNNQRPSIAKCLEILDEMKSAYTHIYEIKDKIIKDAQIQAEKIISNAYKNPKLDNNNHILELERNPQSILDDAYHKSNMLLEKTKKHLDKTFCEVENFFYGTLKLIKINREELSKVFNFDKKR